MPHRAWWFVLTYHLLLPSCSIFGTSIKTLVNHWWWLQVLWKIEHLHLLVDLLLHLSIIAFENVNFVPCWIMFALWSEVFHGLFKLLKCSKAVEELLLVDAWSLSTFFFNWNCFVRLGVILLLETWYLLSVLLRCWLSVPYVLDISKLKVLCISHLLYLIMACSIFLLLNHCVCKCFLVSTDVGVILATPSLMTQNKISDRLILFLHRIRCSAFSYASLMLTTYRWCYTYDLSLIHRFVINAWRHLSLPAVMLYRRQLRNCTTRTIWTIIFCERRRILNKLFILIRFVVLMCFTPISLSSLVRNCLLWQIVGLWIVL